VIEENSKFVPKEFIDGLEIELQESTNEGVKAGAF